jgi:hypothetical protein
VDKRQDISKLEAMTVRIPNHVDIQDHFVIEGTNGRADPGALMAKIIDPTYGDMKTKFNKKLHDQWERRDLEPEQIQYAAKDAYVCCVMYCRISSKRSHLTPAPPNRPPLRDNLIMPY